MSAEPLLWLQFAGLVWGGGLVVNVGFIATTIAASAAVGLRTDEVELGFGPTKAISGWGITWRLQPLLPLTACIKLRPGDAEKWSLSQVFVSGVVPWLLFLAVGFSILGAGAGIEELRRWAGALVDFRHMSQRLDGWVRWASEQPPHVWLSSFGIRTAALNLLPLAAFGGSAPVRWILNRTAGRRIERAYLTASTLLLMLWGLAVAVSFIAW